LFLTFVCSSLFSNMIDYFAFAFKFLFLYICLFDWFALPILVICCYLIDKLYFSPGIISMTSLIKLPPFPPFTYLPWEFAKFLIIFYCLHVNLQKNIIDPITRFYCYEKAKLNFPHHNFLSFSLSYFFYIIMLGIFYFFWFTIW
jgi:hypothetical protein